VLTRQHLMCQWTQAGNLSSYQLVSVAGLAAARRRVATLQ
jgi:hypothetical protein